MNFVRKLLLTANLCLVASESMAQGFETTMSGISPDAYLGYYNSALGGGFGVSAETSERWTIGVKWFGGKIEDTEFYKDDYGDTRLFLNDSQVRSDLVSVFGRFRILETLSVTGGIDRKWSAARVELADKQNFFRQGRIYGDSTVTSIYAGLGNYWRGERWRAGVDWIGLSLPVKKSANVFYSYQEPMQDGLFVEDNPNPEPYYRSIASLTNDVESNLTTVGATLLFGNLSLIF